MDTQQKEEKATILVVEDDIETSRMISILLEREGYSVLTAYNGSGALEALGVGEDTATPPPPRPDLILLDIMMEGPNGFEVCERYRQHSQQAYVPIIMLTALDSLTDKIKGLECGADDYISKPFKGGELVARIRATLRVKHLHDERRQAEEALAHRAAQLDLINEIGTRIAAELDPDEVIQKATSLVQQSFEYHHVAFFALDPAAQEVTLKAVSGSYADHAPEGHRLKLTEGIIGWVASHGSTHLANDVRTDPHYAPAFSQEPLTQAELCVPVKTGAETVGVLDIQSPNANAFDDGDVRVIETLASQIAVAIENAYLFEQLHTSRERLRQLTQQVVSAQEEERRRLSRELHDEAGQAMTALKIALELIHSDLPKEAADVQRRMREAVALTEETMDQIRLLAQDLRPPALDAVGLDPTMEDYCRDFGKRTRISIDYTSSGLLVMGDAVNICLYRFLQEALTNIAKHSDASHVKVSLRQVDQMVTLSVQDDGQGFDANTILSNSGHDSGIGLLGMQERLELLGGWLEIDSRPGRGTRLVAHVPWQGVQ